MRGGRIYVGGRKRSNNAIMQNTKPCVYCAELLSTTNTNWIVYVENTQFKKTKIQDLI
jgi:deoxycytidylate deaminase